MTPAPRAPEPSYGARPNLSNPVTKNFLWGELVRYVDQWSVPSDYWGNLRCLAVYVLQPIRDELGIPVTVTSGYRTPRHNKSVEGADHSQHIYGEAADILCEGLNPLYLASAARQYAFKTIVYPTHVHVSIPSWDLENHPTPYYSEAPYMEAKGISSNA